MGRNKGKRSTGGAGPTRENSSALGPPSVSIVVPAHNEEELVERCVRSALGMLVQDFPAEAIVVDDGSTDDTVRVAARAGGDVVSAPHDTTTIAEVRNFGARRAAGEILIFLDADVVLRSGWGERFREIARELRSPSRLITGSQCQVPDDPSWIEEYWFQRRLDRSTHLGSGHLLINREFFRELDGFDERLVTGEDYDLCRRALKRGATVRPDPRLEAVHHGFPTDIVSFARREVWHGTGDFASLSDLLQSKVALASLTFSLLLGVMLVGALTAAPILVLVAFGGMAGLIATAALVQYGFLAPAEWLRVVPLYVVYFGSRSVSLIVRIRQLMATDYTR